MRPYHGVMAKLLFNLRNVPADEAEEVRALLREQGFAVHETPPSPWGISAGAIWLDDAARYARAKACLDAYQRQRHARAAAEREAERRAGTAETFLGNLRARPVQTLAVLLAMAGIVALVLALPWWFLSR